MNDEAQLTLEKGIAALQLNFPAEKQNQIFEFLLYLKKWNQIHNLTSIEDLTQMVIRHVLDSLAIAPYIQPFNRILDMGTGAGFPGIPLAFCYPDKKFYLMDSNGKKVNFLHQVKLQFHLENIEPIHARAENYKSAHCYEAILSRAVSDIKTMIKNSQHLLCPNGKFLFMKGLTPTDELKDLPNNKYQVTSLKIPFLREKRHLIIIESL